MTIIKCNFEIFHNIFTLRSKMQNRWCFLQQHHIEDTSPSPFSSVVGSIITSKSRSLGPTAAPSSIISLLPFILHCQLITSLKAFYLTGPGDSEEIWRGQELELDRETTAGINKHYLAWCFPKLFLQWFWFQLFRLLLPPGNQRDRHSFVGTPMLPYWRTLLTLCYLSPKVATVVLMPYGQTTLTFLFCYHPEWQLFVQSS